MDIMNACKNSWPTDHTLFESAKLKAPEQAKKLDELLQSTEQLMRAKDILDHRVGQILGLEVMVAHEWPTDRALFNTAIVKANSLEDYAVNTELQQRWILVKEDMKCKTQLDELIVQILVAVPVAVAAPVPPVPAPVQQWTEEDYKLHCLPKDAGPYDHLTEEDWADWEQQQQEAEKNEPWCDYCHPQSGCDGDHGDEMRDGFILRKGPLISPLTVPQPQAQPQPICSPTLQCSWPEFCRCGWQYHPLHEVAQFRGGTAEWDAKAERWTWTSTSTSYSSTWSQHFPLQEQPQPQAQQIQDYIEEVDQWTRDTERLIAESKAIREAPLSAFAELAGLEDDDTIPEVDIEAA
jgi:hypothetical protein